MERRTRFKDSPGFESQTRKEIQENQITLVAEEFPFDEQIVSKVHAVARSMQIPYVQIDLLPQEWAKYSIEYEMKARCESACLQGQDVRLSHADGVRENLWLARIERSFTSGRVLIVCGYLHADFLDEIIERRGGKVLVKVAFPANLLARKPERTLNPPELGEYLGEKDGYRSEAKDRPA